MSLQKKLGYTDKVWKQLKEFADLQFDAGILGDEGDEGVFPFSEKCGVSVCNPWYDASARFHLSDDGAVEEWSFDFIKAWCEEAEEFIKAHGFEKLKAQLEKRIAEAQ